MCFLALFVALLAAPNILWYCAADNGLVIPAGQPAKLNFAIPHHVDITKPSYRGTRFYKNEKLLGVIHKADKTPNCTCTEEGICQRLNLQLNTTQANVEISKTQITDGGSYSVEVIFTDVNSNFRSSQTLDVIKGNATVKPSPSKSVQSTENVAVGPSEPPKAASSNADSGVRALSALSMLVFSYLLKML